MRLLLFLTLALTASAQDIVTNVRIAIARNNFALGENLIHNYEVMRGSTPEMIEAESWLARGAMAAKDYDKAVDYAAQTHKLATAELAHRKLDSEPRLPLALGASIEVQAQAMAARGERGEAVLFLRRELKTYAATSIRPRIQKNINLLSLEGRVAPPLDEAHWLGPKPTPIDRLRGRPVILFFWAHWCPDCKLEAPLLAQIASSYAARGLVIIGPTQHYGYVAGGAEATRDQETAYIDSVRKEFYSALALMPAPLSEENFNNYGASTTPTLVFVDRKGIVKIYHPGAMTYDELLAGVRAILP
jgi:thiol-disulfide isomerase/thioredoxin